MNRLLSRPILSLVCKQQNINKVKLIQKRTHIHDTIKGEYFWGLVKEEACYGYRDLNYASNRKALEVICELGMGAFWWWVGYNVVHHWQHLVGEFVWPEYKRWSDEELGIPPLD